MKSHVELAAAAALIAGALDGFDAAETDKVIAATRALRGVPNFAPPTQPPTGGGGTAVPWPGFQPTHIFGMADPTACAPAVPSFGQSGVVTFGALGGPACAAANPSLDFFTKVTS